MAFLALHVVHAFLTEYAGRRRAQARLAYLSKYDEVTGRLSRRGLLKPSSAPLEVLTTLAIQVLRLDLVRGALGKQVDDRALKLLGERLNMLDLVPLAVIDEDRFALVLRSRVSEIELERLALRIRIGIEPGVRRWVTKIVRAVFATGATDGDGTPAALLDRAELALSTLPSTIGTGYSALSSCPA